jgi:DNA-binding HxlR family transcriptional regulator
MTNQVERERLSVEGCPIERTIRLLSGEWTTHILWKLSTNGPTRFGALRRQLGSISAKVLTAKLRHLETVGLVCRQEAKTVLPEVTYELTSAGREFDKLLKAFEDFALKWEGDAGLT